MALAAIKKVADAHKYDKLTVAKVKPRQSRPHMELSTRVDRQMT